MPKHITESQSLEGADLSGDGTHPILVLTPGWGSSGYYSTEVVENAAGLVTAGTHMYLDHPSDSERADRPERSVRDIAAVITEDAHWDPDQGGLVAECKVVAPYRDLIDDLKEHIGLSIRGSATDIREGEADGRRGPIVEGLAKIDSVDFVTHAGRGGKVLQLLESARTNARALKRGVSESSVNDRREALDDLIRAEYGGDNTWVWLQDFDDTTAWFEVETPDEAKTWQQTYTTGDNELADALTGERIEVRRSTQYVPVNPAGRNTEESEEDTMPQIEEARLRQLEADAGRVTVLESERDTAIKERDHATAELAKHRALTRAAKFASERVTEANGDLSPTVVTRIVTESLRDVPLSDKHELDEARFGDVVDKAQKAEETYLASLAPGGQIANLGKTGATSDEVSESDIKKAVAEAMGRPQVEEA